MLKLYHTSGCHLCEAAQALILQALQARGLPPARLRLIEIADEAGLLERYGVLIPVLRDDASGSELHWPFALQDILRLLDATLAGGTP
jgi:hypothetical protein